MVFGLLNLKLGVILSSQVYLSGKGRRRVGTTDRQQRLLLDVEPIRSS